MRRAAVVVLDACGAGALPDAADYGDPGADTLVHVAQAAGGLHLPHLEELGLGLIREIRGVGAATNPVLHGRLHPLGPGKDSATGHWELMGAVTPRPLPTFPDGFPPRVTDRLTRATGHTFCLNAASDGMAAIERFGGHHLRTGELILYTSADSVLQVAAHDAVLAEGELQELCRTIRGLMTGEDAVGRVIARPFTGDEGHFRRTEGRKDFAVDPPGRTYLDALGEHGVPVHAVGKVRDLFAGKGIDAYHPGATNATSLASTTALLRDLDHGLVFTNLVETDQLYGHRKDVAGFKAALEAIDAELGVWRALLREDDLLILTADHGVDPRMPHHDHTREHVPLLAAFHGHGGRRHDGPFADVGASVLRWLAGAEDDELPGTAFV